MRCTFPEIHLWYYTCQPLGSYAVYIPWDPPLVLHVPTSWQLCKGGTWKPFCQRPGSAHFDFETWRCHCQKKEPVASVIPKIRHVAASYIQKSTTEKDYSMKSNTFSGKARTTILSAVMAAMSQLAKSVHPTSIQLAILQYPSEKYDSGSTNPTHSHQIMNSWK